MTKLQDILDTLNNSEQNFDDGSLLAEAISRMYPITSSDNALLVKIMAHPKFTLTKLNLSNNYNNNIGPNVARVLADALKENETLTELDLSHNNIGPNGAMVLADVIQVNSTLTKLNLYGNSIGPNGARALADVIQVNHTLTELNLAVNSIDDGVIALAHALQVNRTLTKLHLGHNDIGLYGARVLADLIQVNHTLTKLDLAYNDIGPNGVIALADALETNFVLYEVDGYDSQPRFRPLLNRNKSLRVDVKLLLEEIFRKGKDNKGWQITEDQFSKLHPEHPEILLSVLSEMSSNDRDALCSSLQIT